MGGVAKEYFKLINQKLFDPNMDMFRFNPDTNLSWFNGRSFESNMSFELVGMLMGIAFYNNYFIDMPIVPTCYKILLDRELDLKDLQQWDEETAKSLQYILDYKASENQGMPLEDLLARTFTVSVENFGAHEEIELVPGGSNIYVTKDNREEFVRLFIEFQFKKQCQTQLDYFKKGFERLVDIRMLQTILTPEDLEQIICGQRTLNFKELQETCKYGGGFHENSRTVKWLWEIMLDEWSDKERRQLLTFSTGTDRAPVNGLKSMKFYIIKDTEKDVTD
jgi:hypothetical protein